MSNIKRIQKELINFEKAKHTTFFIKPVDNKLTHLRALIIGPIDTPYEGGFFYFDILLSEQYPFVNPSFKFLTPNSNQRIHPNLYQAPSGKVCLSILGTWQGEGWSSLLTIEKVLITISGLLTNNPITNEPSFEKVLETDERAKNYSILARYLTLETIISMLSRETEFKDEINEYFKNNKIIYENSIKKLESYDKKDIYCFHSSRKIDLKSIKDKLNIDN